MSETENKPIKILLVEDNPGDARLLQIALDEAGTNQFALTHAKRHDEALRYLEDEGFDVVLLDLSLPDSQGLNTFTSTRAKAPEVPIIMMTGLDNETLALESMQHGAQDYLVKGQVDGKLLTRSIKYAIERSHVESALRDSEETARRLADENAVLAEIGRIIGSSLNIDDVYERFAEEVRKLVPFDRIAINLVDLENGTYRNAYVTGTYMPARQSGDIRSLTNTIIGEVVRTQGKFSCKMQNLNELPSNILGLANAFKAGLRVLICVPLFSGDRIIGALTLMSTDVDAYTDSRVALVENVATQVAGAIANSKLHSDILKTEEALSQSEQLYRHMIEEASDLVYSVDVQGNLTYVNPIGLKITGYSEDEIIGRRFTHAITQGWKERVWQFYSSQIENQEPETLLEFPIVTKSGEVKWIEQTATLLSVDGKAAGFQVIGRDVTKRKQIEEERERLIAKLQEAAAKIKTMSGLLPICASCKKIRDDTGYWNQIESYIQVHSDAEFSHSICPECVVKLYPEIHLKLHHPAS